MLNLYSVLWQCCYPPKIVDLQAWSTARACRSVILFGCSLGNDHTINYPRDSVASALSKCPDKHILELNNISIWAAGSEHILKSAKSGVDALLPLTVSLTGTNHWEIHGYSMRVKRPVIARLDRLSTLFPERFKLWSQWATRDRLAKS